MHTIVWKQGLGEFGMVIAHAAMRGASVRGAMPGGLPTLRGLRERAASL